MATDGITLETGNRGTLVMIEPELKPGLTRRVFKRMPDGSLDWTSLADWRLNNERARWFGFGGKELPESMRAD